MIGILSGIAGSASFAESLGEQACLLNLADAHPDLDAILIPLLARGAGLSLVESEDADWARECLAPLAMVAAAVRRAHSLFHERSGHLIFVVGDAAIAGRAGTVAQAALAEGVRSLARSAAGAWADSGLRVTTIIVDADRLRADAAYAADRIAPLLRTIATAPSGLMGATIVLDGAEPVLA